MQLDFFSFFRQMTSLKITNMHKLQESFLAQHTTTEMTHMVKGQIITFTKQTQKQINKSIKYKKAFLIDDN